MDPAENRRRIAKLQNQEGGKGGPNTQETQGAAARRDRERRILHNSDEVRFIIAQRRPTSTEKKSRPKDA